jgi:hypothetical protein
MCPKQHKTRIPGSPIGTFWNLGNRAIRISRLLDQQSLTTLTWCRLVQAAQPHFLVWHSLPFITLACHPQLAYRSTWRQLGMDSTLR